MTPTSVVEPQSPSILSHYALESPLVDSFVNSLGQTAAPRLQH